MTYFLYFYFRYHQYRLKRAMYLMFNILVSLYMRLLFFENWSKQISTIKNAAKRSRQHAGKKYWDYAQRHVCCVNEQVP